MFTSLDDDHEWHTNTKGNHVLISGGIHCATVFHNGYCWRIIVNGPVINSIVADEYFEDPEQAKWRAETIAAGKAQDVRLKPLKPRFEQK